jgi:hypothetical protein
VILCVKNNQILYHIKCSILFCMGIDFTGYIVHEG